MSGEEFIKISKLFLQQNCDLNCCEELNAHGLKIQLRLETPKLLDWLKRYMDPWFAETSEKNSTDALVKLDVLYADNIVSHIAELMARLNPAESVRVNKTSKLRLLTLGNGIDLLFEEREGVVYLVDRLQRQVKVAYGFRSRWPGKVLTGVVVEVLIRYLESKGYCNYHAGAFTTDKGVMLVIGDGGSGKTTLLAGLVSAGAKLVANERCFVRASDNGITALTFPQMLFVGLGTAQQFPALDRFIADPSSLAGLQRRFSRTQVGKTRKDKLAKLNDKLAMLPTEFSSSLSKSKPVLGGAVIGIIEPAIDFTADVTSLTPLENTRQIHLIKRNTLERGRDRHFSHWLDLDFVAAKAQTEELSMLPAFSMKFCVEKGGFRGVDYPLDVIHKKLDLN